MRYSNAELGRHAAAAVVMAAGLRQLPSHFVNKTKKYISVKIETKCLTDAQLRRVAEILNKNPRFLAVHNGRAESSAWRLPESPITYVDKVMVRFTQE